MKNEELAMRIQAGESDLIEDLWLQVEPFIRFMAGKYLAEHELNNELAEDLVYEGYFGLLAAVKKYDPDGGASFATFLRFQLISCFKRASYFGQSDKAVADPLNRYESLLNPVPGIGNDDLKLQDILVDSTGEEDLIRIETDDFWRDVNKYLCKVIYSAVLDLDIRKILLTMLKKNVTFREAFDRLQEVLDLDYRKTLNRYNRELRNMRAFVRRKKESEQMRKIGLTDYISLAGSGFNYFDRTGTSITERDAIRLIEVEKSRKFRELLLKERGAAIYKGDTS